MKSRDDRKTRETIRIIYASGGGADLVNAHKHWEAAGDSELQVSMTFSGQIAQFCADNEFHCLMLSTNSENQQYKNGLFTIRHLAKRSASGWRYHYGELLYALRLLIETRRFGANLALVDSGITHFFFLAVFWLFGVKLIPILHNAVWPNGFPPRGIVARVILRLNGLFWHYVPHATLVVSPAIKRQIEEIAPRHRGKIVEFRAQFDRAMFAAIRPPPDFELDPFTVLFVGRADFSKGIVDLADIAALVEKEIPGRVRWVVCGDGPDLGTLRQKISKYGITLLFDIKGQVKPKDLITLYREVHAVIVPTRSSFAEGLAMTAIESVLAGRPVITSSVVPAQELIRPACIEATTDDCASYADAVVHLATDEVLYRKLRNSTRDLTHEFTDVRHGLTKALNKAFFSTI